MDETTVQTVVNLENYLSAGDIVSLFKSSGAIFQLGYIFDDTCNLNELFYVMTQWCYKTNCSMTEISVNFQKNLFVLTGAINEIAMVLFQKDQKILWVDTDSAFQIYLALGLSVGNILRVILNF